MPEAFRLFVHILTAGRLLSPSAAFLHELKWIAIYDDFGQEVPPLYIYLKGILDKYPEGGQILKEIIQNADDAGATEVKFLYDNTEYPHKNLWSEDLRDYHGPALYAFNNSKFTDKDWLSIQRPEQSCKADDPLKVGRFGLGFNSVYHITDLPSVLSGKWLGVFDPLGTIFAYDPYKNMKYANKPGKKWKLKGELLSQEHTPYSDQFKPYLGIFGCDRSSFDRGYFDGTLFRFPLRKHPSVLSSNVITADRIVGPEGWITSFKEDIGLTLLFLKKIESIYIYERHGVDGDIELLQGAKISETIRHQVRSQKTAFLDQVQHNKNAMPISINVEIEEEEEEKQRTETKHWIVAHQVKKPELESEMKVLTEDKDLQLLPWVGAAMEMEHRQQSERGRLFCFLPLPPSQTTGLPVHIHGYFGLGDNRRSIKWPDTESKQDKTAKWNQLLTSDAIPEVYAQLILTAITEYRWKPDRIYAAWPDPSLVKSKEWQQIFKKLLKLLVQHNVFYTDASGGKWVQLSDAIFDIPDLYGSTDIRETVVNTMLGDGAQVVIAPPHVIKCLENQSIQITKMSAQLVRNQLKKGTSLSQMTRQSRLLLLEYVLSDQAFHDLQDLILLPLDDGSFTSFSKYGKEIFIATDDNPQSLLPNMENRFVASNLKHTLQLMLQKSCSVTQLTLLTATNVVQNVKPALPYNWTSSTQSKVLWYPGKQGAPPQHWLSKFWTWFGTKHEMDISRLEGLPLIPIDSGASTITLLKLQRGPRAIFKQVQSWTTHTSLPDEIVKLVERLGYFVVKNQASWLQHTSLNNYIASPNASGVLKILLDYGAANVARFLRNNTNLVEPLCSFLRQLTNQDIHEYKHLLVELPLFISVQGEHHLSIRQCGIIAPSNFSDLPCRNMKKYLLVCKNQSCLEFAEYLGARQIGFNDFLDHYVLPELQNGTFTTSEALSIMSWILSRSQFDTIIKKYKCIPSKGSCLLQPGSITDPENTLMVTLLGDSNTPTEAYSSEPLLAYIRRAGLSHERDISSEKLYFIAKDLHISSNQISKHDRMKGEALLIYINTYYMKLQEIVVVQGIRKSLAIRLKSLSWIPCVSESPTKYPSNLDWFGSQGHNALRLYRPGNVTVRENRYLVGSTMPILPLKDPNPYLTSLFQWKHPLDGNNYMEVQNVVCHLKMIVSSKSSIWSPSSTKKSTVEVVTDIYKFLSTCNINFVKEFIKGDGTTSTFPWIWEGRGFTHPEKVSLLSGISIDMKPYLFTLPSEFTGQLKSFFLEMGVSQQFTQEALIDVLQQIQEKHAQALIQDQIERDLKLSCAILQVIVKDRNISNELKEKVLVPRSTSGENRLLLVPAYQCLYRDREWLSGKIKGGKHYVVHEDIPTATAKKLGLKPLSHFVAPTDGLGYDLAGPHETVIKAIKRNLDMYKEGEEIFKEIIQNADDAGASEVKFLIDHRQNTDVQQRLLDPEMRHCHGPALWAYNDALFSDDDIENICQIASASKKETVEKIGRFGLGFTSVYHITDVPSLVSGHHVMMFDPRMTHLKSRINNPSRPGVKLDLQKDAHRDTMKTHPDQFMPYLNVFGCNITEKHFYNATLFRLPLRSEHQVTMENIITDKVYQIKTLLEELIPSLKEAAPTLLLFTQNVKKLSVSELKAGSCDGSDAVEILSINSKLIRQLPRAINQSPVAITPDSHISKLQKQTNILTSTSQWIKQENDSPPETSYLVEMSFESKPLKTTSKKTTSKEMWFISSCASNGAALKRATEPEGRKQGVLPCGGIAAKLVSGETGLIPSPIKGTLYSFLPVAVPTGLPVHINASFALQPNRRHIWSKTTDANRAGQRDFEAKWNHDLMSDVICKAFINLSTDLTVMQDLVGRYDFQMLWPDISKCESDFHPFVIAFYKVLCGKHEIPTPAIIHNDLQWVKLHQCILLEDDVKYSDISKKATTLLNKQCHPRKVIYLLPYVQRGFQQSGAGDLLSENTYTVNKLYSNAFFQCVDDLAPEIRNPMLTYLLDKRMGTQKDRSFDSDLMKHSCIPVSPDGLSTDLPNRLVDPQSLVGNLFNEDDGRFPYGEELRTSDRLLSLRELGMATTKLTWEDICDRALSVSDVLENDGFEAAVDRTNIIMKVMENLIDDRKYPDDLLQRSLSEIPFLPVLSRPTDYPLEWRGRENGLSCGRQLCSHQFANIIGSVEEVFDESKIDQKELSHTVLSILGIQVEVSIKDAVSQLKLLIQSKDIKKLSNVSVAVYEYLQTIICEEVIDPNTADTLIQTKDGMDEVVEQLRTLEMFWVSDAFVGANRLAFNWQEVTSPYLYKVPREIMKTKRLLQICGVREEFGIGDYLSVLGMLKTKKGTDCLNNSEHKIAITMIRKIGEMKISPEHFEQELFVPDAEDILRSTQDLTFDDDPYLRKKTDYIFSHSDVPWALAKKLGIVPAREKKAREISSFKGFTHSFGQKEELTNRLKDILKAYPDQTDVLKELLQNADDAKATEVHVIYDPRLHPEDKIFCNSWRNMQNRPAICVYNNTVFSDGDIEGIQQVGIGGKQSDAETTGQYGIGFNSVYHLTDCPSFLSDNRKLGIFDPHIKYITDTDIETPGILFDPVSQLRDTFEDTLSGYLGDKISLEGGTMFRLPLRKQGDISCISDKNYDKSNAESLLENFQLQAFDSLLFLNHVKIIKISKVSLEGHLEQLYCVEAVVNDDDNVRREKFTEYISTYKMTNATDIPPSLVDYNLKINDAKGRSEDWLVVQQFGFSESPTVDLNNEDIGRLLPRVGVAALVPTDLKNDSKQQQVQVEKDYKAYCFLPLPIHTNLPVQVNGHFALDRSRRYLWNNSSLRLSKQDFHSVWNEQLISKALAPVYSSLLKIAGHRYLPTNFESGNSEGEMNNIRFPNLEWYHNLFPRVQVKQDITEAGVNWTRKGEWNFLAEQTLTYVSKTGMSVLPLVRKDCLNQSTLSWHEANSEENQAYFDALGTAKSHEIIRRFLLQSGFKLLASPMELYRSFKNSGVDVCKATPEHVQQFMRSQKCQIGDLPCNIQASTFRCIEEYVEVLKYMLDGIQKPNDLKGLPLMLLADDTISVFSEQECPYLSCYKSVLPSMSSKFIHQDVVITFRKFIHENDCEDLPDIWKELTPHELSQHLHTVLPDNWRGVNDFISLKEEHSKEMYFEWLKVLWKYLCSRDEEDPLKPLNEWPIIPVNGEQLVCPAQGKSVLNLFSFENERGFRKDVIDILQKLDCPEIDCNMIETAMVTTKEKITECLKQYVASPLYCKDVLLLLAFLMKKRTACFTKVTEDEAEKLLQYFQEDVKSYDSEMIGILKSLPLYRNHNGGLISIDSYNHCHLISGDFPTTEDVIWKTRCNCVLLSPIHHLQLLLQIVGAVDTTVLEIYKMYIIPNFPIISQNTRLIHMKYIRDEVLPKVKKSEKESLVSILSLVEFIPTRNGGIIRRPDYFYDPNNPVFKIMEGEECLLPEHFRVYHWFYFLKELGLKTEVTHGLFLQYANTVAANAIRYVATDEKHILDMSKTLMAELSENIALHVPWFLVELSRIKFIPSARVRKGLWSLHPPYKQDGLQRIPFICYRGNTSESEMELAWTSSFLLPWDAIPRRYPDLNLKVDLHKCLGIYEKQSLDSVIIHCQNICHRMAEQNCPETEDTVPDVIRKTLVLVLKKLYERFNRHIDKNKETLQDKLYDTPLIPVDDNRVLVRACQLAYHFGPLAGDEFQPYMYTPPRSLGLFERLFKVLGTTEEASFLQYSNILSTLHDQSKSQTMDPNEEAKALAATKGLFHSLAKNKNMSVDNTVKSLYLPSTSGKLILSTQLYSGTMSLLNRMDTSTLEFVMPLNKYGCDTNDEALSIDLLPTHLKPKDVSEYLQEKLSSDAKPCIAADGCHYLLHFKEILQSQEFESVLLRLVRHQRGVGYMNPDKKSIIVDFKERLTLFCMKKLETVLFDTRVHSNTFVEKSQQEKQIICEKDGNNYKIYLKHGDIPADSRLLGMLAERVNKSISNQLKDCTILPILLSKSIEQFHDILTEDYSIPEYGNREAVQENDSSPGKPVPSDIIHLLDDNPINTFRQNDVVAFRKATYFSNGDGDESYEFIFGKVKVVIKQEGQLEGVFGFRRRYAVDIGGLDAITVSGNDLYKFQRPCVKPRAVEVYTGPRESDRSREEVAEAKETMSLVDAKNEIDKALEEAFQLSHKERHKVVHRLNKRWHPDKNPGNEYIATESFKYLRREIDRREEGRPYSERFSRFYDKWDDEATRQRQQREEYEKNFSRNREPFGESSSHGSYVPPSFNKSTPNPTAARIWFEQAEEDLSSAEQDLHANAYAWACFKIQQAAEKALKAAKLSIDGKPKHDSTSLLTLAYDVQKHPDCPDGIEKDSDELEKFGCDFNATRYPRNNQTASGFYTQDQADGAIKVARRLLGNIKLFIGIKRF
ncbi:sacsin-like [Glandiceps talaboti]